MAIVAVVDACTGGTDDLPDDILDLVDAAYPFHERKYQPYKDWRKERTLFITALRPPAMPTADDVAACEVARDLIEDGDPDQEILASLLAQAPNRLARKCGACGAAPGKPCRELGGIPSDEQRRITWGDDLKPRLVESVSLLVPHHARLVGHLDAGPLFTSRSA
jgi:hypothetical protein